MELVLMIFAVSGLATMLSSMDGPFNLLGKLRSLLFKIPVLGPSLFKALNCDFCLGCYSGAIVYMLATPILSLNPFRFVLWFVAGGMINLLMSEFRLFLAKKEG